LFFTVGVIQRDVGGTPMLKVQLDSDKLRQVLVSKLLSVSDLAKLSEVTIYKLFKVNPVLTSITTARKITEALGLAPSDLSIKLHDGVALVKADDSILDECTQEAVTPLSEQAEGLFVQEPSLEILPTQEHPDSSK
jgi:hypothetical protein